MKNNRMLSDIIIDQIIEMIDTNVRIYFNNSDKYFKEIKKYCNENIDKEYEQLDQRLLSYFTMIVLLELSDCPFLYDYRALE